MICFGRITRRGTIDFSRFKEKDPHRKYRQQMRLYAPIQKTCKTLRSLQKDKLVIVGFQPIISADGNRQLTEEIKEFCKKNYGVTFPMAARKVSVKGDDIAPIYKWLCSKAENGAHGCRDQVELRQIPARRKGNLNFPSKVKPMDAGLPANSDRMTKLFITTLLLCVLVFSPAVSQTRSIYDFMAAGL